MFFKWFNVLILGGHNVIDAWTPCVVYTELTFLHALNYVLVCHFVFKLLKFFSTQVSLTSFWVYVIKWLCMYYILIEVLN